MRYERVVRYAGEAAQIVRLACRNVPRHRARTSVVLAAIAFGVAALVVAGGYVHDVYAKLAETLIHSQTGHIQIAKATFFTSGSRSPEKNLLTDPQRLATLASRVAPDATVMSRLTFAGLVDNGRTSYPVVGEGVEPAKEAALASHATIVAGRALSAADRMSTVVGRGLADALRLAPGDRVNLLVSTVGGAMNTLELEVVGVSQSFSKDYDLHVVRLPLATAQELMDTTAANAIVVLLAQTADTHAVAAALERAMGANGGLAVKTWDELNDFYKSTVDLYDRQFLVLRIVVIVLVVLAVANAINMAVFERAGEFGTMRTLGNRSGRLFVLILVESAVLGLAGAVLGVALGAGVARIVSLVGIPMPAPPGSDLAYTAQIMLVPSVIAGAFVGGFVAAAVASVVPAFRVSTMPLVDALGRNR